MWCWQPWHPFVEKKHIEVLVSSADLKEMSMMVNCPGVAVDPSEVVPLSTRLQAGHLEGLVQNLTEGFKDFKNEEVKRWSEEKQKEGSRGNRSKWRSMRIRRYP